jgi:hypothetical protein
MQIKITLRFHLTPVIIVKSKVITTTTAAKDVVKQEPLYTVGENASQYNHCGCHEKMPQKKAKIELPYDAVIPLLGIYPKEHQRNIRHDTIGTLYTDVHHSTIHNSQVLKTAQKPYNR